MICQELLKGFIALTVGLIVARVGLWMYFRQKEYELVKQRYLEQSVDVVASELEVVLGTLSHNCVRCNQILREYRDMKDSFDPEQLSVGFLELDLSKFQRIAHYRLRLLIKSEIIWNVYQLALAFATFANAMVASEIPANIKARLKGQAPTAPHSEMVTMGFAEIKKIEDEGLKFDHLLTTLQEIAKELEQQKLDFNSIRAFDRCPAVVTAIEHLTELFSVELKPYAKTTAS